MQPLNARSHVEQSDLTGLVEVQCKRVIEAVGHDQSRAETGKGGYQEVQHEDLLKEMAEEKEWEKDPGYEEEQEHVIPAWKLMGLGEWL